MSSLAIRGSPRRNVSSSYFRRLAYDTTTPAGFRDFTLFYPIYSLGLRLAETVGIDLADIDWAHRTVVIHGKGRRNRTLPIPNQLCKVLRRWRERRVELPNSDTEPALFLSRKGNRLAGRTVEESLQRTVNRLGKFSIDKITPHTLRHCFASHALETEHDLIVLKAILGHASMESTELYLHPSMRLQRPAINNHVASEILVRLRRKGVGSLATREKKRKSVAA